MICCIKSRLLSLNMLFLYLVFMLMCHVELLCGDVALRFDEMLHWLFSVITCSCSSSVFEPFFWSDLTNDIALILAQVVGACVGFVQRSCFALCRSCYLGTVASHSQLQILMCIACTGRLRQWFVRHHVYFQHTFVCNYYETEGDPFVFLPACDFVSIRVLLYNACRWPCIQYMCDACCAACKTLNFCKSFPLYSLQNANGHEIHEGHEGGIVGQGCSTSRPKANEGHESDEGHESHGGGDFPCFWLWPIRLAFLFCSITFKNRIWSVHCQVL